MDTIDPKKRRKLEKLTKVVEEGKFAILEHLLEVEDKIDELLPDVKEIIKQVKGDDGKDSDPEEVARLLLQDRDFVRSLTPEDGKTPSKQELVALIAPLIPSVVDGKTPSKAELVALIKPLIPQLPDTTTVAMEAAKIAEKRLLPFIPKEQDIAKDLPKFGDRIRDGLELLPDGEKLRQSAIEGLEEDFKNLKLNVGKTGSGGLRGLQLYTGSVKKGMVNAIDFKAGTNATVTHSKVNGLDTVTIAASGGSGSGDVTGQASSIDSEVAIFSGTTGKAIKRATTTGIAKLTAGVLSAASSSDIVTTLGYTPTNDSLAMHLAGTETVTGIKTFNAGTFIDKGSQVFDVRAYGAIGDAIYFSSGAAITSGTATLTVSTPTFSSGDVGKKIMVLGAGPSNGDVFTTISAYTSSTQVTIGTNASTTVASSAFYYGTECRTAFINAVAAASAAGGGVVWTGPGKYICGGTVLPLSYVTVQGAGKGVTTIFSAGNFNWSFYNPSAVLNYFEIKDLTIDIANAKSQSGVLLYNAQNCLVDKVEFKNCENPYTTGGGWFLNIGQPNGDVNTDFCLNNRIIDCDFVGHSGTLEMFLLFNAKHTWIIRPRFQNKTNVSSSSGPGLGLWQKCYDTHIIDPKFIDMRSGSGTASLYFPVTGRDLWIENPYFNNVGVCIAGSYPSDYGNFGATFCENVWINNPVMIGGANSTAGYAMHLGGIQHLTIENPYIEKYDIGISLGQGPWGDPYDQLKYFTVNNPVIKNSNTEAAYDILHPAIRFGGKGGSMYGEIIGGHLYDDQGTPTQTWPISFGTGYTYDNLIFRDMNLVPNGAGTAFGLEGTAALGTNVKFYNITGLNPDITYAQGNVTGATSFNRLTGKVITATLTGNITVTVTVARNLGDELTLILTQDATGGRTAGTWTNCTFGLGGSVPTLSTAANAIDIFNFVWDGSKWREKSRELSTAGPLGDVVGPASATDNAVARFDATTGKLVQNSAVTISDTGDLAAGGKINAIAVSNVVYTDNDSHSWETTGNGNWRFRNAWNLANGNGGFEWWGGNGGSVASIMRLDGAGKLGIGGITSPTAVLHLKAGTTTANTAPLKLTSGALNSTAEPGAVEFLTDKYYGTITTGAARKTFAFEENTQYKTFITVGTSNADYITDGVADDVQIQQALDYVAGIGGGRVYIKSGSYAISAHVNVGSNTIFEGNGYSTLLTLANSVRIGVIDRSNTLVRNLRIDANAHTINNNGLYILNPDNVTVQGIWLLNAGGFGIFSVSNGSSEYKKLKIIGNTLSGKGNNDVIGGGPVTAASILSEVIIQNNFVTQNGSLGVGYHAAIDMVNLNKTIITGNITSGSIIFGGEKIPHYHTTVSNNIVRPATGLDYCQIAILTSSDSAETDQSNHLSIVDNQVIDGHILAQGQSSSSTRTTKVLIALNQIETSSTATNVEFTYGIQVGYMSNVSILGNIIEGASRGINYSDISGCLITNNTFETCASTIVSAGTNTNISIFNNPGHLTDTLLGNVGIGITPTAVLHLKAGTTAANTAPLKLTSGPLNTTAEAGAIEFLTDKFYATITTGAARKELLLGDSAITEGVNIVLGTTTGTKIGTATTQKIAFYNQTPIVQPTTAIAASTFAANTSGTINDTATFDGYTIGQVVKALRNMGILA